MGRHPEERSIGGDHGTLCRRSAAAVVAPMIYSRHDSPSGLLPSARRLSPSTLASCQASRRSPDPHSCRRRRQLQPGRVVVTPDPLLALSCPTPRCVANSTPVVSCHLTLAMLSLTLTPTFSHSHKAPPSHFAFHSHFHRLPFASGGPHAGLFPKGDAPRQQTMLTPFDIKPCCIKPF